MLVRSWNRYWLGRRHGTSGADKEVHDTTHNARKCVTPFLRKQGDAWYEWKDHRRCPRLPRLRKAISTETSLAETMQPSLPAASLCSATSHDDIVLVAELPRVEAYDGLVRGELEHAVSASSSMPSHHFGVLMSAAGRFLMGIDCQLRFEFPIGADYNATTKQFESHPCHPISANEDAPRVA